MIDTVGVAAATGAVLFAHILAAARLRCLACSLSGMVSLRGACKGARSIQTARPAQMLLSNAAAVRINFPPGFLRSLAACAAPSASLSSN